MKLLSALLLTLSCLYTLMIYSQLYSMYFQSINGTLGENYKTEH